MASGDSCDAGTRCPGSGSCSSLSKRAASSLCFVGLRASSSRARLAPGQQAPEQDARHPGLCLQPQLQGVAGQPSGRRVPESSLSHGGTNSHNHRQDAVTEIPGRRVRAKRLLPPSPRDASALRWARRHTKRRPGPEGSPAGKESPRRIPSSPSVVGCPQGAGRACLMRIPGSTREA